MVSTEDQHSALALGRTLVAADLIQVDMLVIAVKIWRRDSGLVELATTLWLLRSRPVVDVLWRKQVHHAAAVGHTTGVADNLSRIIELLQATVIFLGAAAFLAAAVVSLLTGTGPGEPIVLMELLDLVKSWPGRRS